MTNNYNYLFCLDIDSIQNYIFNTNKLKTIIGASRIIDIWNTKKTEELFKNYEKSARLLYSSGGNTKALFKDDSVYEFEKEMIQSYQSMGISVTTLVLDKVDLKNEQDFVQNTIPYAEEKLAQKKYNKFSMPSTAVSPYF